MTSSAIDPVKERSQVLREWLEGNDYVETQEIALQKGDFMRSMIYLQSLEKMRRYLSKAFRHPSTYPSRFSKRSNRRSCRSRRQSRF